MLATLARMSRCGRIATLVAAFVAGSALSFATPSRTHGEGDAAELLKLLEARGESATSLELPFTARGVPTLEGEFAWFAEGWWASARGRVAAATLTNDTPDGPRTYEWSAWDGARSTSGVVGIDAASTIEPGALLQVPVASARVSQRPFPGALSRSFLPTELGYGIANQPWGKYLSAMVDLRVLGRETVRGVDCVRLAFDMGRTPGKAVFPWVLWVDDRDSCLVLRSASYRPDGEVPAEERLPLEGLEPLSIEGQTWVPSRCVEVLAWTDLECGLRIGTRGTVRNGLRTLRSLDADIEVRVDRVRCGAEVDPNLFEVELLADAIVHDETLPSDPENPRGLK